jgi:hypothetical protein
MGCGCWGDDNVVEDGGAAEQGFGEGDTDER